MFSVVAGHTPNSSRRRLAAIAILSLFLSSFASHVLAYWLDLPQYAPWHGIPRGVGIYRRIGPETGPQMFCAGSSLLISALSWPEISESFGQGIENWSVGGSSPDIWEEWQEREKLSNMTIIGVSVYDLNEMHLAEDRANIVPLSRTIDDLWVSDADPALAHRVLKQYALNYVRFLFPTAGHADKVLVGLRHKAAEGLRVQASLEEYEGVVHEKAGVLDVEEDTTRISDWLRARLLRRIAALRDENGGRHEFFNGPKRMALHRMLFRAQQQGRVIILVLPVSSSYSGEFIDKNASAAFEKAIDEATAIVPEATVVRLDRVPRISDPPYFFDLVHLNSFGRSLATKAFLTEMTRSAAQQKLEATFKASPAR